MKVAEDLPNGNLVGLISEYRLPDVHVVALLNPDSTTGPDARRHFKNLLHPTPFGIAAPLRQLEQASGGGKTASVIDEIS
ncbi:hypothetical protein KIP88_06505 [Bradyrhizobium sp. SRL28]|uniref:hypothetical protein n=1 Tax=Bradyrhizobium sp. SRL28 TaxID=2836178 RepID=UPI001BDF3898|nr:hypothetical protein [Bradyrhizobium sp. SRL28]MBT1510148.1 hypothetical protein [Bradyrhizobium sp. SRL28]